VGVILWALTFAYGQGNTTPLPLPEAVPNRAPESGPKGQDYGQQAKGDGANSGVSNATVTAPPTKTQTPGPNGTTGANGQREATDNESKIPVAAVVGLGSLIVGIIVGSIGYITSRARIYVFHPKGWDENFTMKDLRASCPIKFKNSGRMLSQNVIFQGWVSSMPDPLKNNFSPPAIEASENTGGITLGPGDEYEVICQQGHHMRMEKDTKAMALFVNGRIEYYAPLAGRKFTTFCFVVRTKGYKNYLQPVKAGNRST
jgi:hypothetical protein